MNAKLSAATAAVRRFLASPLCWRLVVGLFLLESAWFVFSARYPMAFDESYHFGLIQLHAQQWSPFFTSQPDNAGVYGAIARDPSYLYHWLMSFPYRLISAVTHSQTAQIITLRLLNIALFVWGLFWSRRIVRRLGTSEALTNSLFSVFILIPVVPFLAATINYDSLFFVAVTATILLTLRVSDGFARKKVDASALLGLVVVMLFASLVKYPYLPVAAVTSVYLFARLCKLRLFGHAGWRSFANSFAKLSLIMRVALVVLSVISLGLFAERYVTNIIKYHNPVPACDVVIAQDECVQYGPYNRDLQYKQTKPTDFHANVFGYVTMWVWGMWYRLYFAISDTYATAPPLMVVAWLGVVCAVLMLVGIILRFRALFGGHPARQFMLYIVIGYALVLFVDGFGSYGKTAVPVAINGRYLIPFLPFVLAFGGLAWSQLLRRRPGVKVAAANLVILVMLLQGGGTMTFIIRSSDDWMWPNQTVVRVNRAVRSLVWPYILGRGNY